jgi:hypothetical protein
MWEVEPESITQPPLLQESVMVFFRAAMRAVQSHTGAPFPGAVGPFW